MSVSGLPPYLVFFAAAALVALLGARLRAALTVAAPLVGFALLAGTEPGEHVRYAMLGFEGSAYRVDRLSLLFGYLFHLAALIAAVFALHVRARGQQVAGLAYAGSALGAVLAGDLVTLFVFSELMALSSVFLIWARGTPAAIASGFRYLMVQVLAGVLLLAGAAGRQAAGEGLAFGAIGLDGLSGWLIFAAFGIKCAFPLLHNWLTDSYPQATPTGTVYLSAFTTKVAVYALARGFAGTEVLVYVGVVMTCFPIFYAVIENDLRRVLAYSMINQLGFMVCGIGIGTALAVNGAVAHAFNDVIFKGLLMMSMGAVLHVTGRINGSDLGGLYKSMPVTTGLCIVGAASISAFPLFSGFVSKSLVMAAALEEGYHWVWVALLFASAGVFHHAGIKIPFFAFFAHDSGLRTTEAPLNMRVAMFGSATLCVLIGVAPGILYGLLPYRVEYWPYDTTHVLGQLQLLFFSALAFVWLKLSGVYPPELRSVNIDAEWIYRWLAPRALRRVMRLGAACDAAARVGAVRLVRRIEGDLARLHGPGAVLAAAWTTGAMVLLVTLLLGGVLLFNYL